MDRNDIIRMARDCGYWSGQTVEMNDVGLERFAALVAAAERQRIIAANAPEIEAINAHIKALEDAVAAEREACANLCLETYPTIEGAMCASAIRARGNHANG